MTVIDFKKIRKVSKRALNTSSECLEAIQKKEMEITLEKIIAKITR